MCASTRSHLQSDLRLGEDAELELVVKDCLARDG